MRTCGAISIILSVAIGVIVFCVGFYYYEKKDKDVSNHSNNHILVRIPQGVMRGTQNKTLLNNMKFYSFLGIPYAKPPIGKLRFKEPEPADPWNDIYDATTEGNECAQYSHFQEKARGHEDCLYLNVFTPQFFDLTAKRYPVMVWIHGGGFTDGSATPKDFGPDLLIEHDVVLVTLNYRVGVFGFLSLLNKDAPGNLGLKDQVLALKWVKNNIHNFGGDPYNVTIFGESAGSASVHYHMLSPLSQGLFHRAIMESGSSLNPWAFTNQPMERAFRLGKILGFRNKSHKNLIQFLQNIPSQELLIGQSQMLDRENNKQCLDFPFPPIVEKDGTGNNFLTEHPRTLLKTGKIRNIPTIIGINSKEGILSLADSFKTKRTYGNDYGRFIPEELNLQKDSKEYKNLTNEIKQFFFHSEPIDTEHLDEFTIVCGDIALAIGVYETINYFLSAPKPSDIYVYEFSFEGKLAPLKWYIQSLRPDLQFPEGVCHGDELGYIFPNDKIKELDSKSTELKIIDQMTRMWTNFAKTETPNGENVQIKWEPMKKSQLKYLNIGENIVMKKTIFLPKRIEFWNSVFQRYHRSIDNLK